MTAPPPYTSGPFQVPRPSLPVTRVELSIACEDLADRDLMSKSDPVCVLFIKSQHGWTELDRTERIVDTQSPNWMKKFVMDYKFEERQMLRFAIYDIDSSSSSLSDHDFLGRIDVSLAEVVSNQSKAFKRKLDGKGGQIQIISEEVSSSREEVTFVFHAKDLDKKDFLGKSDPYLEVSRSTETNQYVVVHRTEVVEYNLNPRWNQFTISAAKLCNGDNLRDLKFSVYDWDSSGDHDCIGSFHTNLDQLTKGPGNENEFTVINKKKQKKKGSKYRGSGTVILERISIETVPTFLDYIQSGTRVNFSLAVDFTGSNGNPNNPQSLHYKDPSGRPNQYVTAISAVGDIIQDYDSDKQFPALGFGAKIPPSYQVSHEFFLNLNPESPFCAGMEGVLAAYYNALYSVQLYGPTNFSPVINHVAKFAQAYQNDPTNYFVLLIITDGVITDLEETKRAIISASSLPLSLIIVGVGDADFGDMNALDSDNSRLLRSGHLVAQRDIVQFVEMRQFVSGAGRWDKEQLARSVLAEIPTQLCSYMKRKSFRP